MPEKRSVARSTLLAVGIALGGAAAAASAGAAGIDKQDYDQLERGRYLTIVGDCAACHTLPGSGHDFAGGRPIETPFGTLFAPNITPDPQTGIGAWTDQEFVDALTTGRGRGGTRLYPAMPYTYYTKITREDALAIRGYLNSVPAVHNPVRANRLPFPLSIRSSMAVWDLLFFRPAPFRSRADKSAEWNRGAYLAEGLGHCGMCHTPKNFLGADRSGERLQGYALQGWFASNITNDARQGLGGWSVDEIVGYLKTGHNRTAAATGLMADTLNLSTSHMSEADLHAIAVYLKEQPGPGESTPPVPPEASMKAGAKIYADECAGCHAPNGQGVAGLFPALDGSPLVRQGDATSLLRVVLRGARSVGTRQAPTAAAMPQFEWLLTNNDVADLLTYVRNSWGNAAPAVKPDDVGKARKAFAERND
jgi:mono/diheme cytochrome c family protein